MMMLKLQIKLLPDLVGQPEYDPHQSGTIILFWRSSYLTMMNLRTMRKRWRAQIPRNGLKAMKSEMGSMYENKVWTLGDLSDGRQAIENKWIFKKKINANGNVTIYKARLVVKGFWQVQDVDYDEIFSLVSMHKSVRIMLAIAAFYDYEIWQMDVKTAFLNGFLEEELYMMQPEGFVDPKGASKVRKL